MWYLIMAFIIIGLIAPFWQSVVSAVSGNYTDPHIQIILAASLPVFFFLFLFFMLFSEE